MIANKFKNLITLNNRFYSTKVYELKTYNVLPKNTKPLLKILKEEQQSNGSSVVLGTWKTELGSVNQIINLVEHDSLDNRKSVNEESSNKVSELIQNQNNLILREFPWAPFKKISEQENQENKVWELRTYQSKPGKLGQWAIDFTTGFAERKKISEPVGVFFSEFGALNTIVHLWPYKSFEDRFRIRDLALKNPIWVDTVNKTTANLASMESKTITPIKL